MKRNLNANAVFIYDFPAVYCVKKNTADTKVKHTNTLTKNNPFKKFLHFGTAIQQILLNKL